MIPCVAIDVDRARVLGIEPARIFLPHQFPHHAEHVHLAVVEEHLGVIDIRLPDDDVSKVDVIDAVPLAEIAAHLDRVLAQSRA